MTGNHGQLLTQVVLTPDTQVLTGTVSAPVNTPAPAEASGAVSLADVRAMLGEQAARYDTTFAALQTAHAAAMEAALDRQERQHRAELDRLSTAHKSAVTALMDRVGRMLVAQRPAPRGPWWARLFGSSKHSKIGGEQ